MDTGKNRLSPEKMLRENVSRYLSKCPGVNIPFPVMTDKDLDYMNEHVVKPITDKMMAELFSDLPDRNGRVWRKENSKILYDRYGNGYYIMGGSGRCFLPRKSGLWINLLMERLEYKRSFEINHINCDMMKKEIDIDSVIHWDHSHPDYLKRTFINVKYNMGKALREFKCVMNLSPIQTTILESLGRFLPNMIDKGALTTPNFNDDKKKLEKVIKKGRKRK